MPPRRMDPTLKNKFDTVYNLIIVMAERKVDGLVTTGGVVFSAKAAITRDGRKFISLPHNNRIYKSDWGLSTNSMGRDGQRIGHYARPLDLWCSERT